MASIQAFLISSFSAFKKMLFSPKNILNSLTLVSDSLILILSTKYDYLTFFP
jgi:hypothetical protein